MWREIRWTEQSEAHIARHAVTPDDIEQLINTRPRYTTAGREGTMLVYGTTTAGRHLLIVLADAPDGRNYVVTARDMDATERRLFDRKAR